MIRGKPVRTTIPDKAAPCPFDHVNRVFHAPAPNWLTINGLCKAELIRRRGPWRPFEAVEFATFTWVDWLNHRRLLQPIGNIPPAEAKERYYATLEKQEMAA